MPDQSQTLANHTRVDFLFHRLLLPVFAIQFGVSIWKLVRNRGAEMAWMAVVSLAAVLAVLKIRLYALKVWARIWRIRETTSLTSPLSSDSVWIVSMRAPSWLTRSSATSSHLLPGKARSGSSPRRAGPAPGKAAAATAPR